ncbi:MAG: nucleotide sugar dehydrogenase [Pseudomonadota bacterium]
MILSVIGLGKLGLCTAACFAGAGFKVLGHDADPGAMARLRARSSHISETGIEELLERAWDNLVWVDSIAAAVGNSDVTFIIVPTPSLPDGQFDNSLVEAVLEETGRALKDKDGFHVVDVVSTVMPGSSDKSFTPLLEKTSGKSRGRDFGLVYNPEFIALGSVIRDFLNPDLVLIGCSDPYSGGLVREVYEKTCRNGPHIAVMSLLNAEISKLSLNCFVTMKISFANELAAVCERTPGADVDVVTGALGADSRVGRKYLKGGLGFGGPCFPRDNLAFQAFAQGVGRIPCLSPAVTAVNRDVVERLFSHVRGRVRPSARVAVLGLSYKPGSHIVEESHGLVLARRLMEAGFEVAVHDPRALDEAARVLPQGVAFCPTPRDCVRRAEMVVLAADWPEYHDLDWDEIGGLAAPGAAVLDCWRILKNRPPRGLGYLALGLGLEN